MNRLLPFLLVTFSLVPSGYAHAQPTAPEEDAEEILATVRRCYGPARRWLVTNVREKGLFHYIYNPETDYHSTSNNALRQLMASRLLAELCREDPSLADLHRRNLTFVFRHWYRAEGDVGYIFVYNKSKLGANAMALRTLVYSPLFEQFKDEARRLARGIVSLMAEDGSLSPWLKEPDYDYDPERLLYFYSGEALLSLVEYYEKTKQQEFLDAAVRGQDYYLKRYVDQLEENYYPALVPWHTLSCNKLYKVTGEAKYARAAFRLNDELLKIQDTTREIGRFYNPRFPQYGTPHSSSDGVYTEGLAYAYELAVLTGDRPRQARYRAALRIAVKNLEKLQYGEEESRRFDRPERAVGALRYSTTNPRIRVDTVQHTLDAFRKLLEVFDSP